MDCITQEQMDKLPHLTPEQVRDPMAAAGYTHFRTGDHGVQPLAAFHPYASLGGENLFVIVGHRVIDWIAPTDTPIAPWGRVLGCWEFLRPPVTGRCSACGGDFPIGPGQTKDQADEAHFEQCPPWREHVAAVVAEHERRERREVSDDPGEASSYLD